MALSPGSGPESHTTKHPQAWPGSGARVEGGWGWWRRESGWRYDTLFSSLPKWALGGLAMSVASLVLPMGVFRTAWCRGVWCEKLGWSPSVWSDKGLLTG
jgi:hypothetical protein